MVNKQRSKYLLERLQERFSDISDKYEGLDGQEYVRKILGDYQDSPRVKISELPTDLYEKIKGKGQITGESSSVGSVPQNYSGGVLPNIGIPWQDNQINQATNLSIFLPLRMIDLKKREVESIIPSPANSNRIRNYAMLSHSWGRKEGKEDRITNQIEPNLSIASPIDTPVNNKTIFDLYDGFRGRISENTDYEKGTLYPRAYKSILKADKALNSISNEKINYLWVDQFGWDQRTGENVQNVEHDREMLKMRRYYANSILTLTSINTSLEEELNKIGVSRQPINPKLGTEVVNWLKNPTQPINTKEAFDKALDILSVIMRSEWRFSSWTYQEGWMSKQNVFMFDDVLVDGRFLAMVWAKLAGKELASIPTTESSANFSEFRRKYWGKYTTPVGWAYEEEKQLGENLTTIRLNVALSALIGRRRHGPLDGILAISGLLPYGHLIEIEKLREWENEPDKIKELKGKIEKLEKKPNKTQEEEQELLDKKKKLEALNNNLFQKALCDVMKVGVMNGYGEFLTWFGLEEPSNSWLPTLKPSNPNRRVLETNMVPRHRDVYCVPGSNLTDTVIEFTERMVGNKPEISVRLKGFKENDVTNVGEFVPLTGIPRMNFYRLNQNNEIETDVLSGRDKVEVGGVEQKIRLAGTKETLGASSTNKGEIDNFISNPTANQKNLNRLKILVPHKDLWKSVKINKDGTESVAPVALLVEKNSSQIIEPTDSAFRYAVRKDAKTIAIDTESTSERKHIANQDFGTNDKPVLGSDLIIDRFRHSSHSTPWDTRNATDVVFAYNNGWKYGSEIRIFNRAKGDGTFEPLRQVSIDGGNTWIDLNWQTRTRGEFRETLSLERKELMDSWQTNYKRIDLVKILDSNGNPNDILNQGNNTDQCIAQIEVWSRPN